MMGKIESLILGMFFGFVPIVFCFLATMVIASIFFGKEALGPWVLWSLVPGVIIDAIFLKKWVRRAYQINNKVLAGIYLFYSVVALGMGMGIPILNFVLGIMAGAYIARRMHFHQADEQSRNQAFRKTAVFCAVVMAIMCCLMTLLGIVGKVPGSKFETPILSFTFTVPVFTAVVLTGGAVLVLLQYWLTRTAARVTIKLSPVIHNL
jgi:ABC-type multidrug transport system fused ATPase/permease subunit